MIAVMKVLKQKNPATNAYEVLDGRYTRLRRELRREFDQAFGNPGLRSGTVVVRTEQGDAFLPVDSWNQLLPAIVADLDRQFCNQIRVRCGSFNQWQEGGNWSKIENIVKGDSEVQAMRTVLGSVYRQERNLAGSSHHRWRSCGKPIAETRCSGRLMDANRGGRQFPVGGGAGSVGNILLRPGIVSSRGCSAGLSSRRMASPTRSFRSWWPWCFGLKDHGLESISPGGLSRGE